MVDKFRLKAAIKKNDGWWASIFSGPLANYLLRFIADIGFITPNHVTLFALFLGVCAAVCFVFATPLSMIVGAILVQLSFIVDCMDGQLARYRQQFSALGAWLDRIADRVKDFLYFFSLPLGFFLRHRLSEGLESPSIDLSFLGFHCSCELWLVWPIAMIALFTVLLIDYYVNQDMKLAPELICEQDSGSLTQKLEPNKSVNLLMKILSFGKYVYQKVPILRFNIGEQALLISLFTMFNAVFPLLILFAGLGSFYVFYWPVARLKGFTSKKS